MQSAPMKTFFLPAERVEKNELIRFRGMVKAAPLLGAIMNGMPEGILILNMYRQIIAANTALLEALGIEKEEAVIGLRPGEAFNCINAKEHLNCGTGMLCRECGAAHVLYQCGMRKKCTGECNILVERNNGVEPLSLLTWGTPFSIGDEDFVLFAIADISHERRRRILERVFFHDVLNTAGGIRAISEVLLETIPDDYRDMTSIMYSGSDRLIHDISSQKMLLQAENRELALKIEKVNVLALLEATVKFFRNGTSGDHSFHLDTGCGLSPELCIYTDRSLLERCLENLMKNAVEASGPEDRITVGAEASDDRITFRVHNTGSMPETVQARIFKSSFSTKGNDRGLGLYSVRLFTERYLDGRVFFDSSEELGTTFCLELPQAPNRANALF